MNAENDNEWSVEQHQAKMLVLKDETMEHMRVTIDAQERTIAALRERLVLKDELIGYLDKQN